MIKWHLGFGTQQFIGSSFPTFVLAYEWLLKSFFDPTFAAEKAISNQRGDRLTRRQLRKLGMYV